MKKRKYEFKFFQKFHSKKFDKNVMIRKLSNTDIYARSYLLLTCKMKRNALDFCDWDTTQSPT